MVSLFFFVRRLHHGAALHFGEMWFECKRWKNLRQEGRDVPWNIRLATNVMLRLHRGA